VKVFFAMGGNFLSATPDTEFTAAALRRCALTAQVSTKLNRAHLVTGRTALILPCLGRSERDVQAGGEQFVTVEDSMGIINPSRGQGRAGVGAVAERSRRSWAGWRGRCSGRSRGCRGGVGGKLRSHPRPDRARGPGL
jgi:hypothetical protein